MFFGGCDDGKAGVIIGTMLLVVCVLVLFYVRNFINDKNIIANESMCGSLDQQCTCAGNETMTSRLSDSNLTKIVSGR